MCVYIHNVPVVGKKQLFLCTIAIYSIIKFTHWSIEYYEILQKWIKRFEVIQNLWTGAYINMISIQLSSPNSVYRFASIQLSVSPHTTRRFLCFSTHWSCVFCCNVWVHCLELLWQKDCELTVWALLAPTTAASPNCASARPHSALDSRTKFSIATDQVFTWTLDRLICSVPSFTQPSSQRGKFGRPFSKTKPI